MANSLSFNLIDLSAYNLKVLTYELPVYQKSEMFDLQDRAHACYGSLEAGQIKLKVVITGTSLSNTLSNVDSVKLILNERESKKLTIDLLSTRYWNARFQSLSGGIVAPGVWEGYLDFAVPDPLAYSTTETSSDFDIDDDPKEVEETPGGTAIIEPVYTLVAGEALNDITLKLENQNTSEELQWEGSLADTEELEINVATWIVKKEGTADMADVSGKFPRLLPGVINAILVTGFSNTGTLNITHRARYL